MSDEFPEGVFVDDGVPELDDVPQGESPNVEAIGTEAQDVPQPLFSPGESPPETLLGVGDPRISSPTRFCRRGILYSLVLFHEAYQEHVSRSGSGLTNGLFTVGCTFCHIQLGFLVLDCADGASTAGRLIIQRLWPTT